MSWCSESGVLNKGDMQNVQSGGSPGTGLKTTVLEYIQIQKLLSTVIIFTVCMLFYCYVPLVSLIISLQKHKMYYTNLKRLNGCVLIYSKNRND